LHTVSIHARFKHFCRRLRRDANKGSAAIEFAMVAPVFFLMMMGTIEAGIMFFAQSSLQNALNDAARLVRTGQSTCFTRDASNNCVAMTATQFRTQICNGVAPLLQNCTVAPGGSLQFDVRAYPTGFTGATNSSPLDAGNNLPNLTTFNVGNACDVVLVRAFYKWPVFTPGLGILLSNMAGSYHLLASAAAFRNEPFTTTTGGC
jgi:Flp pilus assembly protein TadG